MRNHTQICFCHSLIRPYVATTKVGKMRKKTLLEELSQTSGGKIELDSDLDFPPDVCRNSTKSGCWILQPLDVCTFGGRSGGRFLGNPLRSAMFRLCCRKPQYNTFRLLGGAGQKFLCHGTSFIVSLFIRSFVRSSMRACVRACVLFVYTVLSHML